MLFQFPVYWFSIPAIMKGWMDRVLTSGFAYTIENLYDNGMFKVWIHISYLKILYVFISTAICCLIIKDTLIQDTIVAASILCFGNNTIISAHHLIYVFFSFFVYNFQLLSTGVNAGSIWTHQTTPFSIALKFQIVKEWFRNYEMHIFFTHELLTTESWPFSHWIWDVLEKVLCSGLIIQDNRREITVTVEWNKCDIA